MSKNNWFSLGMAVLSLTLIFGACGEMSSGNSAGQVLVIGPAASYSVQVYSAGSNSGRASYRLDWAANEFLVNTNTITEPDGMTYAADYSFRALARQACYWADGGERGPPRPEGGIT